MSLDSVSVLRRLGQPRSLLHSYDRQVHLSTSMTAEVKLQPRFHSRCGLNVIFENDRQSAKWCPRKSGGIAFSSSPLKPGSTMKLAIDGSGHIEIGIMPHDSQALSSQVPQTTADVTSFRLVNEVRVHKRQCLITLHRSESGEKIETGYGGANYSKNTKANLDYWLVLYVRFGHVTASLTEVDGRTFTFSNRLGSNVRFTEGNSKIGTLLQNPAAVCFLKEQLHPESKVTFTCAPILDGSKTPSRYHLTLYVSTVDPETLYNSHPALFDTSLPQDYSVSWTRLEILEKEECHTTTKDSVIAISLGHDNTVLYKSATRKINKQRLNGNVSGGLWLVLELYRVSVSVKNVTSNTVQEQDLPDGRLMYVEEPDNNTQMSSYVPHPDVQPCRGLDGQACAGIDTSVYTEPVFRRRPSDYITVIPDQEPATHPCVSDQQEVMVRVRSIEEKVDTLAEEVAILQRNSGQGGADKMCDRNSGNAIPASKVDTRRSHPNGEEQSAQQRAAVSKYISLEDAMRKNWTHLLRNIIVQPLCDYLFQYEVIGVCQMGIINTTLTLDKDEACRKLLGFLRQKPPTADLLETILKECEQSHLIKYFLVERS